MTTAERQDKTSIPDGSTAFRLDNATSQRPPGDFPVEFQGRTYRPGNGYWKTSLQGFERLGKAQRISSRAVGSTLCYVRFVDDFPAMAVGNVWGDMASGDNQTLKKMYVVQTLPKVIERCLLMTTDPGDLVFDPTCGSGTTAYVAEKWGRRWITCDTSRVAVTLAKQRLMTASYDYFELRYPHEGLRGGFIWKTVPHVTLKSIANNPDIDAIYERLHPAVEAALAALNRALLSSPSPSRGGAGRGWGNAGGRNEKTHPHPSPPLEGEGTGLQEWEVPFDFPAEADVKARPAFEAFHAARQSRQKAMDRSIADHADQETLYDQPAKSKTKRRITGPFSVEAVPFPTVQALDDDSAESRRWQDGTFSADASIARSGESSRQHQWRDELLKTGIRGKGGQILKFAELETLPGTKYLHATGHTEDGQRVVVHFGPEHAALEQRAVTNALEEAGNLFPLPKMIVFCAFAFDPEAAKDIDHLKGIVALKAQMNTDLLTEDLKKARASNQSFWLMGQPDVAVRKRKDGLYEVEVNGFDYFDTAKGELVSGGKGRIAMWSLDTDYDERSLFPHQVFFPLAGKGEGWEKLKKDIRAELDEDALEAFHGTVSLPFAAGDNKKVAVKIVDDRGIESLRIVGLED
jgi:adenine-specific DNA-methyltransferase